MNDGSDSAAMPRRLPGDEGLWFFLAADLVLFLLLFGSFSADRAANAASFSRAREHLMPPIATLNTLFLVTSSWLAATAVHRMRHQRVAQAAACTCGAALIGFAFIAVKTAEYTIEVHAGVLPTSGDFFMYYFVITGIHLLHVIGGVTLLGYTWLRLRRSAGQPRDLQLLESSASLWHVVDILWLIIFPMFYLIP